MRSDSLVDWRHHGTTKAFQIACHAVKSCIKPFNAQPKLADSRVGSCRCQCVRAPKWRRCSYTTNVSLDTCRACSPLDNGINRCLSILRRRCTNHLVRLGVHDRCADVSDSQRGVTDKEVARNPSSIRPMAQLPSIVCKRRWPRTVYSPSPSRVQPNVFSSHVDVRGTPVVPEQFPSLWTKSSSPGARAMSFATKVIAQEFHPCATREPRMH